MKSKSALWVLLLTCMVSISSLTSAQPNMQFPPQPPNDKEFPEAQGHDKDKHPPFKEGDHERGPKIQNLTKDQEASLKKLHISLDKELLPIENQIGEKEAKLRSLTTSDKADIEQINSVIDEISVLKAKIEKLHAAMHQNVRKLLNDEQRIAFDRMPDPGQQRPFPPPPQNQ